MAKGALPSQEQLLELMKRAAEELKHAQEEARTAVLALQKEQAAHRMTEAELETALNTAKSADGQPSTDEQLLKDQVAAERDAAKTLGARVKELEAALEGATTERAGLQAKVSEAETAVLIAQQQHEAQLAKLAEEHQAALDASAEQHRVALEAAAEQHRAAAEAATAELQRRVDELQAGQQQAIDDALALQAARIAELEALLREAEAQRQGVLDDAAARLVQAEGALDQEREKHQTTAQKLLETRSKVRELEALLTAEQDRVRGLESAAKQLADAHQTEHQRLERAHAQALTQLKDQHQQQTAELQQSYLEMQTELQNVTARWREVEHQYEALHREMLLTLEQRDDARRLLENEKAERERLQRALQTHR